MRSDGVRSLTEFKNKERKPIIAKIFEKNGNRYTYSVTGMNSNTNIADALFVFDAKTGISPGLVLDDV